MVMILEVILYNRNHRTWRSKKKTHGWQIDWIFLLKSALKTNTKILIV